MRTLALALAACVLGGCSYLRSLEAVKVYDGPERRGEEGIVSTQLRGDTFAVTEGVITSVDGVSLPQKVYGVRLLAGTHWLGVLNSTRQGSLKREQFCAFEMPIDPQCVYRPVFPSYPGVALDAGDQPWQVVSSVLVNVECSDTSYATRVTLECASRPLCRGDSGCPKPGMRCTQEPAYSFGACASP